MRQGMMHESGLVVTGDGDKMSSMKEARPRGRCDGVNEQGMRQERRQSSNSNKRNDSKKTGKRNKQQTFYSSSSSPADLVRDSHCARSKLVTQPRRTSSSSESPTCFATHLRVRN